MRRSTFSATGTSIAVFWIGVRQLTSPTPGVGASLTGCRFVVTGLAGLRGKGQCSRQSA
jgi:hypothetical protein